MKPNRTLLLSLAAALWAGSCQSMTEQNPTAHTSSNWNSASVSESASESFFGASSQTPHTIRQVSRDSTVDVVTTTRRHLFNDNPDNPLQEHYYEPDERYVPIWDMPVNAGRDGWDILKSGGKNLWNGTVALAVMPWQFLVGADQNTGVADPADPEDFRVRNR